jgi:hypothetical protein
MESIFVAIDSMNLAIHKGTKQSMRRYIEGNMTDRVNLVLWNSSW